MKQLIVNWARLVVTAGLMIAVAVPQLYAMDGNGRYFASGLGQRSCEDYVKFREKRHETLVPNERYSKDELYEIVDMIVEHWLAGFLTAHNYYVTDTYNVAGNENMENLKLRIEKICRANGKLYFAEAVITLSQELHPQRAKADAGK
jgi:hypothetical protein